MCEIVERYKVTELAVKNCILLVIISNNYKLS